MKEDIDMFVYEEEVFEYWGSFFDYVISNNLNPITIETDNGEVVTFDKDGNISINVPNKEQHWFEDFVSCKIPTQPNQKFKDLIVTTEDDIPCFTHDASVEEILNEYKDVKRIEAILDYNDAHVDIWIKGDGD